MRRNAFMQHSPYAVPLLIGTIVCLFVAVRAWQLRAAPMALPLAAFLLCVGQWAGSGTVEALVVSQTDKILWAKIEYLGLSFTPVAYLSLAFNAASRGEWLTRRRVALLCALALICWSVALTNDWHHLLWPGFLPGPQGTNSLIYLHGPAAYAIYSYFLIFAAPTSVLLSRACTVPSSILRRDAAIVLVAVVVPWIGATVYAMDLNPWPGLDLTIVSFCITALILAWAVLQRQLLDLVPVARDSLVEHMQDALLVFDLQGRLVDANPAARLLMGGSPLRLGQSETEILSPWPAALAACIANTDARTEIELNPAGGSYAELRVSPVRDPQGRGTGKLLVFRDISASKAVEASLHQANEQLRSRLDEIHGLQAQLREEAIRDALTGLFNRRFLNESLPAELARAQRAGQPISVVLLDLDNLKVLNDAVGHDAGDAALKAVGDILHAGVRSSDIACRIGGDEFLVALPGAAVDVAARRADGWRRSLEHLKMVCRGQEIRCTLSAGVAALPTRGGSPEHLLCSADEALYAAKAAGGNRVVVAADSGAATIQLPLALNGPQSFTTAAP